MLQSMRSMAKYIWILVALVFVGGFLLYETSGLSRESGVTATTAVATVNRTDITWQQWQATAQRLAAQEEQNTRHGLTLDERVRIDDRAFEQLVGELVLQQEYEKRGIRVTDDEIKEAARFAPPPALMRSPELLTNGQFDMDKYQRLLASPAARQQGILLYLENFYREEIPKQKLLMQIAGDAWVTDARLWSTWQDTHDSVVVTWVGFEPASVKDDAINVGDNEISAWYTKHQSRYDRPGRAVVSVVRIVRTITAADSAAVRARIVALRNEIVGGKRKFEDAAKELSTDTTSGSLGGDLGKGVKGRFVKPFEEAASKLSAGQLSEPVLTEFGYHLIRLDSRKGDTLALHHILLAIRQSDSAATRSDRKADTLASIAGSQDKPQRFDSAARVLHLPVEHLVAIEGEPLMGADGRYIPSVSAWAFGGARPGETSDLYDADDFHALARLDSVRKGGPQPLDAVKDEIRQELLRTRKLAALADKAREFAKAAAASSLEAAAKSAGYVTTTTEPFTRIGSVNGLGQATEAIGAAFSLPVGAVSAPIATRERVIVMRVDRRATADKATWAAQKAKQRESVLRALREQRVREYLDNLRKTAKLTDRRREIRETSRRAAS